MNLLGVVEENSRRLTAVVRADGLQGTCLYGRTATASAITVL